MEIIILYFFLIAGFLFLPFFLLSIIAAIYSVRPKNKTLSIYKVLLAFVLLFYSVLAFLYRDFIEDLFPYIYIGLFVLILVGFINAWLIHSGQKALKETELNPVRHQVNEVRNEKTEKRVLAYILVSFLLHFISISINHFLPNWFNSDLVLVIICFYFLNTLSFLLLLSLINKPIYKILACVLIGIYLFVQAWEYLNALRFGV